MTRSSSRRGEGLVDALLVLTLAALAVVVVAYVYMPDFERSLKTLVRDGAAALGLG